MISNVTNITLQNITSIGNSTTMPELLVKVNHIVFNDWFWFLILWVLWIIFFIAAQTLQDRPIPNALYSFLTVTVIAFMSRAITATVNGATRSLITDHQLWSFFIILLVLAMILYANKT